MSGPKESTRLNREKRCRDMFFWPKTGSSGHGCARAVRCLRLLIICLGLLMIATAGQASACSPETPSVRAPVAVASYAMASASSGSMRSYYPLAPRSQQPCDPGCCGDGPETSCNSCAGSSCFSCSMALLDTATAVGIDDPAVSYISSASAALTLTDPDSQFRPPRRLV